MQSGLIWREAADLLQLYGTYAQVGAPMSCFMRRKTTTTLDGDVFRIAIGNSSFGITGSIWFKTVSSPRCNETRGWLSRSSRQPL
jgi:hypothetical protein